MMRSPTPVLPGMSMCNALTIDVEDYFQVSALAPYIARSEWETRECRIERNVARILAMLDEYGVRATFFTLGWVAERYPKLLRDIVANGHELASHGFAHQRATAQSPAAFFSDIQLAKIVLEDIAGVAVKGYRAPSFSIGRENEWAFECIERAGYRYSSSIYPIRHDHYGAPDAPRFTHDVRDGLVRHRDGPAHGRRAACVRMPHPRFRRSAAGGGCGRRGRTPWGLAPSGARPRLFSRRGS